MNEGNPSRGMKEGIELSVEGYRPRLNTLAVSDESGQVDDRSGYHSKGTWLPRSSDPVCMEMTNFAGAT